MGGPKCDNLKHASSSVKHDGGNVTAGACMAASGAGSLIFTDDVTDDEQNKGLQSGGKSGKFQTGQV